MVDATSSFNGSKGNKIVPVTLRRFGHIIKLSFQDSKKYAGIVTLPVLGKLLDEFNVRFTATLSASASQPSQKRGREKTKDLARPQECSVHIVVYGLKRERSAISNVLSGAGLYLQQPSLAECDRDIEYSNPHYLVRPGCEMPKLESTSSDVGNEVSPARLDDVKTGQFMQLFDLADNNGIRPEIKPSPRLRSSLKEYVSHNSSETEY